MSRSTLTAGENYLVYIVILNWNGLEDTSECLKSCRELTYSNFRIVVVDNASNGNEADELAARFSDIELIKLDSNLGYAGGNNAGIRHALNQGADSVWLLNNDTVVESSTLGALVHELYASDNVGCVGSKIYYFDRPDILWFAGGFVDRARGLAGHTGQNERDIGQHDVMKDVGYITGCSLLISREILTTVGMLDEDFFLLFEDTDFCSRVQMAGYFTRYVPESKLWHKVSRSIGNNSLRYEYYIYRNSLLFVEKLGLSTRSPICERVCMLIRGLIHDRSIRLAWSRTKGIYHYLIKRRGALV
ncbi:glycosyltransferase family 2 protein [Pelobacter propionicus]|uniref:Glycosyl transferase, family 2 n=1 Tax=Pelobacter propionicus (strain DSM 2379 / NBRC 103807 / OttBd1) TaxID=338966 RepID=A1AQU2_PELPD|nr:glycosyltransferase family 2 protein [Pelobacter propionicus]ABK99712.1 glycosyl transferase, family 2 [Pelobacter propionicus DSM 2379]